MPNQNLPPRFARWLLRRFAHADTLEEVEGDLDEFFQQWLIQYGSRRSNRKYWVTVLTMLRPFKIKRSSNHRSSLSSLTFMLKSFFIMSWRTIVKNRVSSLINVSGLTLGLTTSIVIMLVVMGELKYNQFHENLADIYVIMKNQITNDGVSTGKATAGPLAEHVREYSEIKYVSRQAGFDGQRVLVNNKTTYESGIYVDPAFFKMMTFPALYGDAVKSLEANQGIVITQNMATKLFGNEDPIGKTVVFDSRRSFTVGAVLQNIPEASSIKFDMALPFDIFEKQNEWLTKWDDNRIRTWVQFQPAADIALFNSRISKVLQKRTNSDKETLFAYPFKEEYLRDNFSNGQPNGGRIWAVQILIGFGMFMLSIACINFMNIATAQSEHRAREVGVRKVLGASRRWIVFQFLSESFIVTFFSLVVAIGITILVIPSFNVLVHASISLDLTSPEIWLVTISIAFVTALLAGSYPSLFLSRFIPARVLKGRLTGLKGGGFRRALVTFQFAISAFFLIGTIIMYAQFQYVEDRPIGYDQTNLIDIQLDSTLSAKYGYLKSEVMKVTGVKQATGTSNHILYSGGAVTGMDWPGKRPEEDLAVSIGDIEYDWAKTIGVEIVDGRDFNPAFGTDSAGCLINESAVSKMGLKDPVGSVVGGRPVIGVFKNFVFNNPSGAIAPMALYLSPGHMNHLYLRIENDSEWRRSIDGIEKIVKAVSPEFPFRFSFTKDEYQHRFNEIADTSLMVYIFGGMTIFISCLGLFGLSGFVAERRGKEMSIRKVFGATISRILFSLGMDFIRPVLYALVLIIPLSLLTAQWALSLVSYRVQLSWWMFASGAISTITISLIIVSYHGLRTARENPVVRLKNE
ncbi:MAG: ABC transporter permease [Chryseolinea sp.]